MTMVETDEGGGEAGIAAIAGGSRGIQSVEIGNRVLTAMMRAGRPLPLKAIAQAAGISASNTHRYLASYVRDGLVIQDGDGGRYDLGPVALQLGLAAMARLDPVARAAAELAPLAEATGFTAHLAVWSLHGAVVVRLHRSRVPFVGALSLGSVMPLLRSATGRTFLAWLPASVTAPVLATEIEAAGQSPSESEIAVLIDGIRRRRVATVDGSVVPGLAAASSPVLDWQNEAQCVLTLIGTDRALSDPDHPAARRLAERCRMVSEELGASA
ncbi:IclR family transcriptional regulator [Tistrella bauzanensis]|uniref:IclR family transcriptional regulator n=1 Tax=Tistrella TaxID=171436 RepID=UPI0031F673E2